jgi:hypothetical protein
MALTVTQRETLVTTMVTTVDTATGEAMATDLRSASQLAP